MNPKTKRMLASIVFILILAGQLVQAYRYFYLNRDIMGALISLIVFIAFGIVATVSVFAPEKFKGKMQ